MAVAYVSSSLGTFGTGTSMPAALPPSPAVGDLIAYGWYVGGADLHASMAVTAGWTLLDPVFNSADGWNAAVAYRIYDGSFSAPTFTWGGASGGHDYIAAAYRGCDGTTPVVDHQVTVKTASSATVTAPSVSGKAGGVVAVFNLNNEGQAIKSSSPSPVPANIRQNDADAGALQDAVTAADGATGAMVSAFFLAEPGISFSLALQPPVAGVSVVPRRALLGVGI